MSDMLNGSGLAEGILRRQHPVLAWLTMKVDTSITDRLQIFPDKQVEKLDAGIGSIHPAKKSTRVKPGTSGEEDCLGLVRIPAHKYRTIEVCLFFRAELARAHSILISCWLCNLFLYLSLSLPQPPSSSLFTLAIYIRLLS